MLEETGTCSWERRRPRGLDPHFQRLTWQSVQSGLCRTENCTMNSNAQFVMCRRHCDTINLNMSSPLDCCCDFGTQRHRACRRRFQFKTSFKQSGFGCKEVMLSLLLDQVRVLWVAGSPRTQGMLDVTRESELDSLHQHVIVQTFIMRWRERSL